MGATCCVEFKGFAYRALLSAKDPHTFVSEGSKAKGKSVRWSFEDDLLEDGKKVSTVKWKELPEGFEVIMC